MRHCGVNTGMIWASEYHVNVNLSVVQLLQNDIVKKVAKVLEETRIIPQNLTLEVTESLAINDISG